MSLRNVNNIIKYYAESASTNISRDDGLGGENSTNNSYFYTSTQGKHKESILEKINDSKVFNRKKKDMRTKVNIKTIKRSASFHDFHNEKLNSKYI